MQRPRNQLSSLDGHRSNARAALPFVAFLVMAANVGLADDAAANQGKAGGHDAHAAHAKDTGTLMDNLLRRVGSEGCHIPEAQLVSTEGDPVQFYADLVQDKAVLISFVYTECTTVCAPIAANIAQVSELLGDRVGRDIHLVSVSIDPVTDTPARLKEWSGYFDPPESWAFLTGDKARVDTLLKGLKVFSPNLEDHPPVMIMTNDMTGECVYTNGLAAPDQLLDIVVTVADGDAQS